MRAAANAAAAQNPGGPIVIMPLLLLLLLSSVESNTNNSKEEKKEEAVMEYSSAFINVSWVEVDRQVKAGAHKVPYITNCCRFCTRKQARQDDIPWQVQP